MDVIDKPIKVIRLKAKLANTKESEKDRSEIVRSNADDAWKESLSMYFKDFMELCWPEAYRAIDWTKEPEFLEQELQAIMPQESTGKRVTDKIVKVWLKDKTEVFIVIHLEVQGPGITKSKFTERMMIYRYRLFDRHRVPVASLAILIDDVPSWRPDTYKSELLGASWQFSFPILKILDYKHNKQELMNHPNPFAVVILAQLGVLETKKDHNKRLAFKTELTRLLFEKGWDQKKVLDFYKFLYGILALPNDLEIEYNTRMERFEKERKVGYMTMSERIGVRIGESNALLLQLNAKFKSIPKRYMNMIEKADEDKLKCWLVKLLNANVIEDIFSEN